MLKLPTHPKNKYAQESYENQYDLEAFAKQELNAHQKLCLNEERKNQNYNSNGGGIVFIFIIAFVIYTMGVTAHETPKIQKIIQEQNLEKIKNNL